MSGVVAFHARRHLQVLSNWGPWISGRMFWVYLAFALGCVGITYEPGITVGRVWPFVAVAVPGCLLALHWLAAWIYTRRSRGGSIIEDSGTLDSARVDCFGEKYELERLRVSTIEGAPAKSSGAVGYVVVRRTWARILAVAPLAILVPVVIDDRTLIPWSGSAILGLAISSLLWSVVFPVRYEVHHGRLVKTWLGPGIGKGSRRQEVDLAGAKVACHLDESVLVVESNGGPRIEVPLDSVTRPWRLIQAVVSASASVNHE